MEIIIIAIIIFAVWKMLTFDRCHNGLFHDYEYGTDLFTEGNEKVLICKNCKIRKK